MSTTVDSEKTIDAQMRIGMGDVALVRQRFFAPIDFVGPGSDTHHLQLSLLPPPEPMTACYPERWSARRFERMGAVFLLPANAMLHARSECRVQQSLVCNLAPDAVDAWFGEALDWPDHQLVGALDVTSGDVRRLLFRIARELKEPGFGSDALVELLAGQVCIELARQFHTMEPQVARGGLTPWRLRLIEEQVATDPGKATLADLASACGLSVRHVTRAYRISCGRTLGDFIAEQRIDRARTLLSEGMSIKQTAFAVGFTAPSNFAAAFGRATGATPREYRSRSKAGSVSH